ncbi:hypothetical protein [Nostoc sp. CMAA1605]|uniref:hypothetical protein n=1 Tax=Nostoc sp. CMAA1605 TaxID=2055159 RepID=UPI001F46F5F2|nr:hypothetical protein [Nostoc sp. CMAA1605]MCF4967589.1 hypothetical protein [Nostoc sp. CMAA1605]
MNLARTAMMSMTILATALVSTGAMAAQPQAEVISRNCADAVHAANYTLVSVLPAPTNTQRAIAQPGGSTEQKTCETTNAPATNSQGVNGTNRCTTCTYSSNGHVTVNCIFIKPK